MVGPRPVDQRVYATDVGVSRAQEKSTKEGDFIATPVNVSSGLNL